MSIFQKKKDHKEIDLLNKFNLVENKIDILNSKFESITFMDGCCECKKRESQIYESLVDFFEKKFTNFESNILNLFKHNLTCTGSDSSDSSDSKDEVPLNNDFWETFKTSILEELKLMCKISNESKIDILTNLKEHDDRLVQLNNNQIKLVNDIDQKLRGDLHTFMFGIKSEIISDVKQNLQNLNIDKKSSDTLNSINELNNILKNIDNKVDGFFFENELIKNQLSLEEEIRKYNDDIESLKVRVENIVLEIDSVLKHFEFVEEEEM
jgi:hypothetical protein